MVRFYYLSSDWLRQRMDNTESGTPDLQPLSPRNFNWSRLGEAIYTCDMFPFLFSAVLLAGVGLVLLTAYVKVAYCAKR